MRILVTGGGGFIGAWIIRRLMRSDTVLRVLDSKSDRTVVREIAGDAAAESIEWHVGDIADADSVRSAAAGCDRIIHLAAMLTPACQADPIRGAHVNLIGTLNLFEAARTHGIDSVAYMSSAGVFGRTDGRQPQPDTHYGAFKLACEGSARAYWVDHGIASVGFRPYIVYGPGREVGLTAGPTLACRAAARGEAYVIPFSGRADYLYVGDLADAFATACHKPLTGAAAYTIVGEAADAEDIAGLIRAQVRGAEVTAAGPTLPVTADLDPGQVREAFPDIPCTSLKTGVAATIAHYRDHAAR